MSAYEYFEGHIIIHPQGDLTFFNIAPFADSVREAMKATGSNEIIVDCSAVKVFDSAALGGLVELINHLEENNGHLKLANVGTSLIDGLYTVRMDKVLKVYSSVSDALDYDSPVVKPPAD